MTAIDQARTGTRIRERRIDLGLRQADLAKNVGISASYLNLIEHNRRRIAGRLLGEIARELEVEASLLMEGADREILEQMQTAAVQVSSTAELSRAEDLASRFPGWAALIADQSKRIVALEAQVQELSDRMSHDPALAASLHSVISSVTSIRSTASILTSDETLDRDWQTRFHRNIHDDAVRLAGNSESLIAYLEAPQETPIGQAPAQMVEDWVEQNFDLIRGLELSGQPIEEVVGDAELGEAASPLLEAYLAEAMSDAELMPMRAFERAAKSSGYDPSILSAEFSADLSAVLRRLSALSPEAGHPPMGLSICDGSGAMLFQKSAPEFGLARAGNACPLWPIFTALGQPGRPVEREVALPGTPKTRFLCYAVAEQSAPRLDQPAVIKATMLAISNPAEGAVLPLNVGPTCRICSQKDCAARREPSVLSRSI